MSIYRRFIRYSKFERARYGKKILDFLATQATRLSGTGTGSAITFTNATNIVNLTTHGYVDGQGPFLLSNSGGALPAELDNATFYWVNAPDANTFTLHATEADGLAGSNVVAFTDDGTGTHNILVAAESLDIFAAMKAGKTARDVKNLTSIDNL